MIRVGAFHRQAWNWWMRPLTLSLPSLHGSVQFPKRISFDKKMAMNLILVSMVCQCNEYLNPESISRKDLGYMGYEFLIITNIVALLLPPCLRDLNLLSFSVSSAVDLLSVCFQFSNMNNPAVDSSFVLPIQQYESVCCLLSCSFSTFGFGALAFPLLTESYFSSERFYILFWLWVAWAIILSGSAADCGVHSAQCILPVPGA
jgi:hypothetical protein